MTGLENIKMLNGIKPFDKGNYVFIVSHSKNGILNIYDNMQKAKEFLVENISTNRNLNYTLVENNEYLFVVEENESGVKWKIESFSVL